MPFGLDLPVTLFLVALLALWIVLMLRRRSRVARPLAYIVVDGSNVMHWKDETPQIGPVRAAVTELKARGFTPGVVFDANAGYKLSGRYMDERAFAKLLAVPKDQVFVVPKGTPADPWILAAARKHDARIVTRDRYRDWAKDHPEVARPGHLVRGGYRDSGAFWLDVEPANGKR